MYPGVHAKGRADQPAFIMAQTGVAVTYAELEQRTNRLAHFLRSRGLKRLDHYAIFMENNDRYNESCGAGERATVRGFYPLHSTEQSCFTFVSTPLGKTSCAGPSALLFGVLPFGSGEQASSRWHHFRKGPCADIRGLACICPE